MKKVSLILVVVLLMTLLFTACGQDNAGGPVPSGEDVATNAPDDLGDEPYTVKMVYPYFVAEPADLLLVQNAINEYVANQTDVNAQVEFVPLGWNTLSDQQTLAIAGDEQMDLMFITGFSTMVSKGELLPLDDLVAQYGPDIQEVLGSTLKTGMLDDELYAISNVKDWGNGSGFVFLKEIVDKYNIDTSVIKTLSDVDAVFETVQAGEPDMTMLASYGSYMSMAMYFSSFGLYDPLGDRIGVVMNSSPDRKVVNYYETEQYRELVEALHDWYNKGYILSDVSTTTEMGSTLMGSGKAFAYNTNIKPGIETEARNAVGKDVVVVEIFEGVKNSYSAGGTASWGIGSTSQKPEVAMQFLNLLYKDSAIINLIDNGIEGTHFVKTDNPNVITFPEGMTQADSGYFPNSAYMFGNELLSYVWEGTDPDLWETMKKYNDSIKESPAFGFNYNAQAVKTQITSCSNVINQYEKALGNGEADPDTALPEFISALKDAGIDDIVAEKQRQLDEWAAAQAE